MKQGQVEVPLQILTSGAMSLTILNKGNGGGQCRWVVSGTFLPVCRKIMLPDQTFAPEAWKFACPKQSCPRHVLMNDFNGGTEWTRAWGMGCPGRHGQK